MVMNRTIAALAALTLIGAFSASAQAQAWKRHTSEKLGYSMPAPRGATFEAKSWADGWVGEQAEHKGVKLIAAQLPGKKLTGGMIEVFGDKLSGIARKSWKVKRTRKARQGWIWFSITQGAQDKQRAFALYGKGRKGMYLLLLLTSRAGARKHRAAITRWTRGVTLQ
jgi:hypothetical protein